jgi:hypothetical protein
MTGDETMATERITERSDGGTTTYVEKGGGGMGAVLIGIGVLALVAIVAFFLLQSNRNDTVRTDAVTSAASSVANSAGKAADSVGAAAGDAVTPER